MGRKLDALLGRNGHFKVSKFKSLVNVAVSRITILKNQHQARSSLARSDVLQLLNLGYHDRALLRVEILIKEDNMIKAFEMIESYCYLLTERLVLLQKSKSECPSEVKEAISSLIFAASRCGEFPELQEIRRIFEFKFGRDFATRAVELRNNCGVNNKMIQNFSTKQSNPENKLKVLNKIASDNGITLHLEEETPLIIKEQKNPNLKQEELEAEKPDYFNNPEVIKNRIDDFNDKIFKGESLPVSVRAKKFKDVASAAQAAFQSAAYAAVAAREAIELSRSESQDVDGDHQDDSDLQKSLSSNLESSYEPKNNLEASTDSSKIDHFNDNSSSEKFSSECENMDKSNRVIHLKQDDDSPEMGKTPSVTNLDSDSDSDTRNWKEQSSNPNSIFQNEPVHKKSMDNEKDEVTRMNEISDKDVSAHKKN